MRILLVHTYYQEPGGEDVVFQQEKNLLSTSHTVEEFTANNQKGFLGLIQTALSPWNFKAGQRFEKILRQFKPDVIHVHNLHYALGPWILRRACKMGIPVVMTLHNYRLLCPSATLFYDGKLFTDSLYESFPWTAIHKGVHSQSKIKTAWLAWTTYFHHKLGTFQKVDRFITLTPFARHLFINSSLGLKPDQMVVKPNVTAPAMVPPTERGKQFLFVGRLSQEKGIIPLIEAFKHSPYTLKIAGQGPLLSLVRSATQTHSNIEYLGVLDRLEIQQQMSSCSALIFPSLWYEGMPMTLLEAFSLGTPVLASRLGAMESMIDDGIQGYLFEAGQISSIQECLKRWTETSEEVKAAIQINVLRTYESLYKPEQTLAQLEEIYHSVHKKTLNGR